VARGAQGPIEISSRVRGRGGATVFPESQWGSLVGYTKLTVFVHGYNVGEYDARAKWKVTHRDLRDALPASRLTNIALYYWPGDASPRREISALSYFTRVDIAVECGRDLAQLLIDTASHGPMLSVRFVGHSLGCRLVLEAARNLRGNAKVRVDTILLMAAAVPEGLCEGDRAYTTPVARRELVLHSSADTVLRRWFRVGQRMARFRGELSPGPNRGPVGLSGQPRARWNGQLDSCGLDHGEYWTAPYSIKHIANLYGGSRERSLPRKVQPRRKVTGS
jgi:pimeloyl-ACP methyl ester carboxylesterase